MGINLILQFDNICTGSGLGALGELCMHLCIQELNYIWKCIVIVIYCCCMWWYRKYTWSYGRSGYLLGMLETYTKCIFQQHLQTK